MVPSLIFLDIAEAIIDTVSQSHLFKIDVDFPFSFFIVSLAFAKEKFMVS
jgi:hypothetical protein